MKLDLIDAENVCHRARIHKRQREAFLLRYVDGLSIASTAERMGVQPRCVYWHLQEAAAKVKEAEWRSENEAEVLEILEAIRNDQEGPGGPGFAGVAEGRLILPKTLVELRRQRLLDG